MTATGIIRRIDELGRVVIPKEIRRTMNIKEGDPLELFIEGEFISWKKYNPLGVDFDRAKALFMSVTSKHPALPAMMLVSGREVLAKNDVCRMADLCSFNTMAVDHDKIGDVNHFNTIQDVGLEVSSTTSDSQFLVEKVRHIATADGNYAGCILIGPGLLSAADIAVIDTMAMAIANLC